jgi:hypothetical protein
VKVDNLKTIFHSTMEKVQDNLRRMGNILRDLDRIPGNSGLFGTRANENMFEL